MKKLLVIAMVGVSSALSTLSFAQSFAGITFDSLSNGMTSPGAYVLALAMKDSTVNSSLYAGGHFTIAGRKSAINVAKWLDTGNCYPASRCGKWVPLGAGIDNDVCAIAMYDKKLYAGGKFDTAGGIFASHIACWDTAALKWDSLLGELNGNVYALCIYNNILYVGGDFTIADGDTVNRIAQWNGTAWSAVGKGFDTGAVFALAVSNDTLYAGGSFLKSNGLVVNHIAKWTGANWDSIGSGTNNTVYALADGGNRFRQLFVGGAFTKSGNISTNYISSLYYNSKTWYALGSGTNDTVRALNLGNGVIGEGPIKQGLGNGDFLLAGGNFTSVGGYHCHYIAGWGGNWDTIGELNGPVFALANPYGNNFGGEGKNYVGGKFSKSTGVNTLNNVAYLNVVISTGILSIYNSSLIDIYPNPSIGIFTMEMKSENIKVKNIEVYNVLGEKVYNATLAPQIPKGALNEIGY